MEQERAVRNIRVATAAKLHPMEPCTVKEDATLAETVRALTSCSGPGVVVVVDSQGRLRGTISRLALAEEVMVRAMAETFLSEAVELEKALEFARWSRAHFARDLMGQPVAVRSEDTLAEAFTKMHRHHLDGLPIVDKDERVVGYLDVSALFMAWLGTHIE